MKSRIAFVCAALCAVFVLLTSSALAQDFRGAIAGTITDTTGGLLPGVTITVTNVETNISNNVVTDAKGFYQMRYLNSGTYSVEAKLEGFRPMIRKGIAVRVGDALNLNFKLELGGVSEVIQVTAAAPLLDTRTPVTGQVVDSTQIQRLPLADGTAYMLTRLAPGLADSSDLHFARPGDNGNLAGITANGAQGGNEFTLDGAPNRVSPSNPTPGNNFGVVGFSPPSSAIAEFKVNTNAFDAQSGHTAGATVNLALKSGTNNIKADVGYYNRSASRTAMPLLTERAGGTKPPRTYDRYLGTVSGPVIQDRTFFMVSYEHLKDIQAEPASYSVPTLKMRAGDFSEFSGKIYDPMTATGSTLTRTAFANNLIPGERINAIAKAILAYYPEPNRPGTTANYFTNQVRPYTYNAFLTRFDHNINNSNKLFLTGYYNKRTEDRYDWAAGAPNADGDMINGFPVTHGFDNRSNRGATLGYTSIFTGNAILDVRGAWSKFGEWRDPAASFDPASLGFSSTAAQLMKGYNYLPFVTFGGFSTTNSGSTIASLGAQRSDFGTGFNRPFTTLSFQPTADYLLGGHALRTGYELRTQRWNIAVPAFGAGRYFFNGAYTRLNNSAPTNDQAQEFAQFLLGIPTTQTGTVASAGSNSSQFEIAATGDWRQASHALFVQDDWHVSDALTLNLGLRAEYLMAMSEANNQAVAGFDSSITNPVAAAAIAAYANNPMAEIPTGQFAVPGGLRFADGNLYNNQVKIMPRAAFSYLIGDKTVIRGGAGLFSYDYYFDDGNQTGFSQPTPIITTLDNGKTFLTDMTNPIPSGQLIPPPGSSAGAATGIGLTLGQLIPSHRETPYYKRFQLGAQHDLGGGWKVEVFGLDSRGTHLPVSRELNQLPIQYLSTLGYRDTTQESYLSQSVPNPFAGLLPGTTMNGATVSRGQLLRPFPQYLAGAANGGVSGTGTYSVGTEEYIGSDHYTAGTISIEKRWTGHNSALVTYTRSHETDKLNFLNPSVDVLESRISPNDRPNRVTVSGIVDLPFGRGQRWGSSWNAFTEAVLGGWSFSGAYQYQTGFPYTWNNNVYYDPSRNPNDLSSNIGGTCPGGGKAGLDCPAWDTSGFFYPGGTGRTDSRIQMGNNIRTFPSTLSHIRTQNLNLLDLGMYKNFDLSRGMNLQIRIEAINALNYTVLWNPDLNPRNSTFGIVNQDRNNPRDIQLGAKVTF